jgi:hypothetical protein
MVLRRAASTSKADGGFVHFRLATSSACVHCEIESSIQKEELITIMLYYEFEPIPADQTETWAPSGQGRVYFNSAGGLRLYLPLEKGGHAGSTALENLTQHHGLIFFTVDVEAGQQYFKKCTASDEGEPAQSQLPPLPDKTA